MRAAAALLLAIAAYGDSPSRPAPGALHDGDGAPASAAPADPAVPATPADFPPGDTAPEPAAPEAVRPAGARLFETWELGADLGVLLPAGGLARVLDPAPVMGLRLLSSYYGPWRAFGSVDLARLDGSASPAEVLMASGTAGLAWLPASRLIPSPALGLAYHYARTLRKDPSADEYLFLEDGESEFGSRASLRWSFPAGRRLALSAGARWEAMFTAPEYGHAFAIHLGAAWTRR